MARTDNLNNFGTDVANAIRGRRGVGGDILHSEFDTEINKLQPPNFISPNIITGTVTNLPTGFNAIENVCRRVGSLISVLVRGGGESINDSNQTTLSLGILPIGFRPQSTVGYAGHAILIRESNPNLAGEWASVPFDITVSNNGEIIAHIEMNYTINRTRFYGFCLTFEV